MYFICVCNNNEEKAFVLGSMRGLEEGEMEETGGKKRKRESNIF